MEIGQLEQGRTRFEYVSFEEEDQLIDEGKGEGLLQPSYAEQTSS